MKDDDYRITAHIIPELLAQVSKRMEEKPMNKVIKRILFGIFLASLVSNYRATIEYLQSNQLTETFLMRVFKYVRKEPEDKLERKLYSMCLTSLLTQEELPNEIRDKSPEIITAISKLLVQTTQHEVKEAKEKAREKNMSQGHYEFDSDYESYSDSDFSDEDSDDDKDKGAEPASGNDFLKQYVKDTMEESKDKEDSKSTDSEEGNESLESEIDIQTNFVMIKTGFNSFDEFNYFKHVWKELYKKHGQQMEVLINSLSQDTQKAIKALCQIRVFEKDGNVMHRRYVTVKRKK